MSEDAVFGPILSPIDVRLAVRETVREWIETYLARVERHYGLEPRSLQLPKTYVMRDDGKLDKAPQDRLPAVVILSPGTAGKPKREGDGNYRASYAVSVAVVVSASTKNPTAVIDLAQYYSAAIMALMVHQGTLGGFAESTSWEGQRNDELAPEDDQTNAAGTNVFKVTVPNVVRKGAGLKTPPEEPYEEGKPIEIKEVEIDLKPEEIK